MKERYPYINPIDDTIRRIENPLHDEMLEIYKLGLKDGKNDVLGKIRYEIVEQRPYIANDSGIKGMKYERAAILKIIDKYQEENDSSRHNNEEIKKLADGGRVLLISEKKLKNLEVEFSFSNRKWVSDTDISIATIGILLEAQNTDVLDKIRADIEQTADEEQKHDEKWAKGLRYATKIIDKYKTEKIIDKYDAEGEVQE